jgi:hypothetical protein
MLTILILVGSLAILVVLLLLLLLLGVVIGIRREPSTYELSEQAPSPVAAFARRSLGVYVRRPHSPLNLDQGDKGHASLLASSTDKPDPE